jgi:hypothetical protein
MGVAVQNRIVTTTSQLNPTTAERLVILRFMLAEAQRQCSDESAVGRHIGLLTLQDTCELAMILALDDLGEQHGDNTRFDELYSRLAGALLDKKWKTQNQWLAVRTMNRARASAQHHGQQPDKVQLNQWATAADVFVRSLIASQFGVDVRNAVAASAVIDQALRGKLAAAEEALYDGRTAECVRIAAESFESARGRWRRKLKDLNPAAAAVHHAHRPDRVDRLTKRVDDLEQVQPFAPDPTGHLRLRHLMRAIAQTEGDVSVSAEEAEHVLGFALGWVLRWEAVNTTFDPDRVRRHWASLRPPTTSTSELGARLDPAHAVVSTRPAITGPFGGVDSERPILSAQLQVVDAPDAGFELWLHELETSLRKTWTPEMPSGRSGSTGSWSMTAVAVTRRGLITLSAPPTDFDSTGIVEAAREAIRIANAALVERRRVIDSWHEVHDPLADPYKQALYDVRLDDRPLVLRVEVVPDDELTLDAIRLPEPIVLIHLAPSVLASAGLDEATLWLGLPRLNADSTIRVRLETTPVQIAQALKSVLKQARERSDLEKNHRRSRSDEEATLTAALFQQLNLQTNSTNQANPPMDGNIV